MFENDRRFNMSLMGGNVCTGGGNAQSNGEIVNKISVHLLLCII